MVWKRIDFPLFHENVLCDLVSCGAVPKWHFLHHQGQLESPQIKAVSELKYARLHGENGSKAYPAQNGITLVCERDNNSIYRYHYRWFKIDRIWIDRVRSIFPRFSCDLAQSYLWSAGRCIILQCHFCPADGPVENCPSRRRSTTAGLINWNDGRFVWQKFQHLELKVAYWLRVSRPRWKSMTCLQQDLVQTFRRSELESGLSLSPSDVLSRCTCSWTVAQWRHVHVACQNTLLLPSTPNRLFLNHTVWKFRWGGSQNSSHVYMQTMVCRWGAQY